MLLLLAVLVIALAGLFYSRLSRSVTLTAERSSAERYFRALGAPPGAAPVQGFRSHDQDGMQNEGASGSYRVPLPRGAVLGHYRAACQQLGLRSLPSAETLTYYPKALCDGAAIVTVTPTCANKHCDVFVEVVGG